LTSHKWLIVEEILVEIWACPQEERGQALARYCHGDTELIDEVASLLEADERANSWKAPEPMKGSSEPAIRSFGPYQLERMIGRGGMGTVYLAHRADGSFEQKVAIKLLSFPFELEAVQERFRQERQFLASLNHPNITRLIDGGITPDGELYLVMEYVDGVPIDVYARREALSESQCLDLFLEVTKAVIYAHQHLIVHRDLKAQNVLVSEDGAPKLLDFGTAKLMSGDDFDRVTSRGLLTVASASPEQLRGEEATTLSDVYSLGVLLYELISGERAFTGGIAARFEADAEEKYLGELKGELALIVRKATAPAAVDRYSSVDSFAEDVRRYLKGRPVLAHPESATYLARKFIRRNRLPVAAATVALLAIFGGSLATLWQAQRAEARFQEVRQLGNYLVFDIHESLQGLPGATALQMQVLERALKFLDALSLDSSASRQLKQEVAAGYLKLGDVLGNPNRASLGDRKRALETYDKALLTLAPLLAANPNDLAMRRLAAQIKVQQAGTRDFGGRPGEGLQQLSQAVGDLRTLAAEGSGDLPAMLALSGGLELWAKRSSAGGGETENSSAAKAEEKYGEAQRVLQSALQANPGNAAVLFELARIAYGRAILWGSSDPVLAIQHHRDTAGWLDRIPAPQSERWDFRRLRAGNLMNLGWAQGQTQSYKEAIANISRAGEIFAALASVDPGNVPAQYQLTSVFRSRGIVHKYNQDPKAAIEDFLTAAGMHRQLSKKVPANKVYRYLRGELLARAGSLLQATGKPVEARAATTEGLSILVALASDQNPSLSHVFGACRWLTETEVLPLQNPAEAVRFCQKAIDLTGGKDPDGWEGLSHAREQLGDRAGALEAATRALTLIRPTAPGTPVSVQRRNMEATQRRLQR